MLQKIIKNFWEVGTYVGERIIFVDDIKKKAIVRKIFYTGQYYITFDETIDFPVTHQIIKENTYTPRILKGIV